MGTTGIEPASRPEREYELQHAGGVLFIKATSTREAINVYKREYGEDWFSCGPKDPIEKIKSIAPTAGAIDRGNYERMMKDENAWEIDSRAQMVLDLEMQKTTKK